MALFSKFFGKTISESAAFALGGAMRSPLEPPLQELTNATWARFVDAGITVPTEPGDAAEIVAEDVALEQWGADQVKQLGYGGDQFDKLVNAVRNGPALGTLYEAWRRGFIGPADFEHGLRKLRLEARWDAALEKLKTRLLDLEPLAAGIQRGLLPAPFPLPYDPTPGAGQIPSFPTANLDVVGTTQGLGYTTDDLFLLTALAGNPPGPEALFRARFRGAIDDADVTRGLVEGRARAEWLPAYEADARAIPSPVNYVEARVRNWITPAQMNAGVARHGMTPEDANLLFLVHGRPISWHQTFIGLRRGGVYDGSTGEIDQAFLKSLQESNIRPEWYNLAWAQRFNYPTAFVLRSLTQDGDITEQQAHDILLFEGWEPTLAATVSAKWAQAPAAGLSPAVKSAQGRFITAIHKAAVGGAITDAQMLEQLALSLLSAEDQAGVAAFFRKERALEQIPPPTAA